MQNALRHYWGCNSAPPSTSSTPACSLWTFDLPPPAALSAEWTPRHTLIENIAKRLMEERLLYIRGPPVSGKSVLMFLLQEYLKTTYPDHIIRSVIWPPDMSDNRTEQFLDRIFGASIYNLMYCSDKILLIDEAQRTYQDLFLWNVLLKQINSDHGVHVVLFSSYGSPSRMPVRHDMIALPVVGDSQRIDLAWSSDPWSGELPAGLLLRRDETADVITRFCATHVPTPRFAPALTKWLHRITDGHAGALSAMLTLIHDWEGLRPVLLSGEEYTVQTVTSALFADLNLFAKRLQDYPWAKGLPDGNDLEDANLREFFLEMFAKGGLLSERNVSIELRPAALRAFETGWIHSVQKGKTAAHEDTTFVFPSSLHRWVLNFLLVPSTPSVDPTINTPLDLVRKVIKPYMSEKKRAMEFYRALHDHLGGGVLPSPEYGKFGKGGGAVDLYIPGYKFGLEILFEGNDLAGRYKRFLPGGDYYSRVGKEIEKWLVLDFRTSHATKAHPDMPNLVRLVFQDEFRTVQVIDNLGTVIDQVTLRSNK